MREWGINTCMLVKMCLMVRKLPLVCLVVRGDRADISSIYSYASSADFLARRFTFFLYARYELSIAIRPNNSHAKSSRTSFAASTFAGEFRSGTSAERREMTEMSCESVLLSRQVRDH